MDAGEVGVVDQRRVARLEVQIRGVFQGPGDGGQPLGPLGMARARPVVQHVGVGVEGERHGPILD